jgi:hypothetical protein
MVTWRVFVVLAAETTRGTTARMVAREKCIYLGWPEDRRVRERENWDEFKIWTVVVIFRPLVGPGVMEINGWTST